MLNLEGWSLHSFVGDDHSFSRYLKMGKRRMASEFFLHRLNRDKEASVTCHQRRRRNDTGSRKVRETCRVTQACGPNTWKMEVGGSGAQFSLSYTVSLRPAWAAWDSVSTTKGGRQKCPQWAWEQATPPCLVLHTEENLSTDTVQIEVLHRQSRASASHLTTPPVSPSTKPRWQERLLTAVSIKGVTFMLDVFRPGPKWPLWCVRCHGALFKAPPLPFFIPLRFLFYFYWPVY